MDNILKELEEAFFDIPFENSDFQNEVFVAAAQRTPGRAYRAIGLRMFHKLRALKENEFNLRKKAIDIDEARHTLATKDLSIWDRQRMELEIERLQSDRAWIEKLANDANREIQCLYKVFKRLPKITRQEFEDEEKQHFILTLQRQLQYGMPGAAEALANIEQDMAQLEDLSKCPKLT